MTGRSTGAGHRRSGGLPAPPRATPGDRVVFAPVGVRVLAVTVWAGLVAYLVLLVRQGSGEAAVRFLPLALLVTLVVHAAFWRPAVVVDDRGVRLRNVLRDVDVPFARLDAVDTRYALRLESGGRSYTAWAAPAPGRTSAMSLTRRDAAANSLLGADLAQGVSASAAPNTDSGGAALLVRLRWQRWLEQDALAAAAREGARRPSQAPAGARPAPDPVTTAWNLPVAAGAAVLLVASAAAVLL